MGADRRPASKSASKREAGRYSGRGAHRIEKLIFESQPQFYVPANVYIPNSGNKPFPAVISPRPYGERESPQNLSNRLSKPRPQRVCRPDLGPPGQGERHDYDFLHRRATYDWFNRWLQNGKGNVAEAAFDEDPASDLNCTSTGQILTSIGGRTAYQVNASRLHRTEPRPPGSGLSKDQIQNTLRTLLSTSSRIAVFGADPSGLDALFTAALENHIRSVLLDRTLSDFGWLVASEDYNL